MADIRKKSLSELHEAIKRRDISIEEITRCYLKAIEENQDLNAFITVNEEGALKAAKECDKNFSEDTCHDLYGIPLAVKDLISTKGIRTTCGSRILQHYIPPFNATCVQKLHDVVILGKTNLDEFGMGSSGENSYFGVTKNPWDKTRTPGGSSSGSAVAVAAGLTPAALATDTGGSIRQPASFCGISGIKPTYGRVSRYGLVAYASSLDQVGVLAHSAQDLAVVLYTIAGHDPLDATSSPLEVQHFSLTSKPIRVGIVKEFISDRSESALIVQSAINKLQDLGIELVEISLPHSEFAVAAYYIIASAEASSNLSRFDGVRYGERIEAENLFEMYAQSRSQGFGDEVKRRILTGTYVLSKGYYDQYYLKAQKVRRLIVNDFQDAFNKCDIIAAPVAPTSPFKLNSIQDSLTMYKQDLYTIPASLAGLPAMSIPCGFDKAGLPVGLQLIGKAWQEDQLLSLAHSYQKITDWHKRCCF